MLKAHSADVAGAGGSAFVPGGGVVEVGAPGGLAAVGLAAGLVAGLDVLADPGGGPVGGGGGVVSTDARRLVRRGGLLGSGGGAAGGAQDGRPDPGPVRAAGLAGLVQGGGGDDDGDPAGDAGGGEGGEGEGLGGGDRAEAAQPGGRGGLPGQDVPGHGQVQQAGRRPPRPALPARRGGRRAEPGRVGARRAAQDRRDLGDGARQRRPPIPGAAVVVVVRVVLPGVGAGRRPVLAVVIIGGVRISQWRHVVRFSGLVPARQRGARRVCTGRRWLAWVWAWVRGVAFGARAAGRSGVIRPGGLRGGAPAGPGRPAGRPVTRRRVVSGQAW